MKHLHSLMLWISMALVGWITPFSSVAQSVNISTADRVQTVEGWGVSLCWWAHMCGTWPEEKIDTLIDWLVSPDGLNYNLFRYNIGGGDDPQNRNCELHHMGKGKGLRAEMPGFKPYPDSDYDWQADSAQIRIMLKIREKRPDAVFEAFSNSAPWYMTESGCCAGHAHAETDNLKTECYVDFAHYLVDVCVHFKERYGLEFRTLEPFNESLSDYWYQNGSQEGCHFDVTSQVAFLKILHPILKASGLHTVISASDETCVKHALQAVDGYREVFPLLGQFNTHTYSGTLEEKVQLREKMRATGIPFWQSETGSGGEGIQGNLNMLQRLFDDMKYLQPDAWLDWQYVEENGDQWNLVRGDFATAEFQKVKNYSIRQQVTRFIKQGYILLKVENDQTLAAVSPDGKELVVVSLNHENTTKAVVLSFPEIRHAQVKAYTTSQDDDLYPKSLEVKQGKLAFGMAPHSVTTCIIQINDRQS